MASRLPSHYDAGLINLWVEDPTTRAYFEALWSGAPLNILPAGGIAGVNAMVQVATQDKLLPERIFGVVDRDLASTNQARWADPSWTGSIYRPDALEIENFLLDEVCIADAPANAIGLDATSIRQLLLDYAHKRAWWMTCKQVLSEINAIRNEPFPPDKLGNQVNSEDDAVALLLGSAWTKTTLPKLTSALTEQDLRIRVQSAHQDVTSWLTGEAWRVRFSGKELFAWIYGQISSAKGFPLPTKIDLAAQVGEAQVRMGRVPPALVELLTSIRRRAGV